MKFTGVDLFGILLVAIEIISLTMLMGVFGTAWAIGFFIVAMLVFVLFLSCSSESPFDRH